MTSRERLIAALRRQVPDRVPAVADVVGPYVKKLQDELKLPASRSVASVFGLDVIADVGDFLKPEGSADWRKTSQVIETKDDYQIIRSEVRTPKGTLAEVKKLVPETSWTLEPWIKEPSDIELLRFRPLPEINHDLIKERKRDLGDDGILKATVLGVWHEACDLRGAENMIMDAFDRPTWVEEFLHMLREYTVRTAEGLGGSAVDLVEIGESYVTTSLLSPRIYEEFVFDSDREIVSTLKKADMLTTCHTCGKARDVQAMIVDTGVDAIETLTPGHIGGDTDLSEAKKRYGGRVCLKGGFDQIHVLGRGSPEAVTEHVRECFRKAGAGGGYIMQTTDHIFFVPPENLSAMARAVERYASYG